MRENNSMLVKLRGSSFRVSVASFCGSTDETEEGAGAVAKLLSRPNRRNKNGDQDIEQLR